jgi:hypothetical protein
MAEGVAQVVEGLPSKPKALNSIQRSQGLRLCEAPSDSLGARDPAVCHTGHPLSTTPSADTSLIPPLHRSLLLRAHSRPSHG